MELAFKSRCHINANSVVGSIISKAQFVYSETNARYTAKIKFHLHLNLLPKLFYVKQINS